MTTTAYKDIRAALLAHVADNLTSIDAGYVSADVLYEGADNEPLDGRDDWVRVDVFPTGETNAEVGGGLRTITGFVQVTLLQRTGVSGGAAALATRLDNLRDLFRLATRITAGSTGDVIIDGFRIDPDPPDLGWMQRSITVSFFCQTSST